MDQGGRGGVCDDRHGAEETMNAAASLRMRWEGRHTFSVCASLILHGGILSGLQLMEMRETQRSIVLTGVEFFDPGPLGERVPVPEEEQPKTMLEFLKMALPVLSNPDLPLAQPEEFPLAEVKKPAPPRAATPLAAPRAPIVMKSEPLRRSGGALDFTPMAGTEALAPAPSTAVGQVSAPGTVEPLALIGKERRLPRPSAGPATRGISLKPGTLNAGAKVIEVASVAKAAPGVRAPAERAPLKGAVGIRRGTFVGRLGRSPRIGYGRGGAISLGRKGPVGVRPGAGVMKAHPPTHRTADLPQLVKEEDAAKAVTITGPLSQRAIAHSVIPQYPAWARERGIQADVTIYFTVSREGEVQARTLLIERTSGYPKLDHLAMRALKAWRFAPLTKDAKQEAQWGYVTFRFVLR